MADKKIEEVARVTSVNGGEIVPASYSSDGGSSYSAVTLTVDQVKGYVLAAIRNFAALVGWPSDSDGVFAKITTGGVTSNQYVPFSRVSEVVCNRLYNGMTKSSGDLDDDLLLSICEIDPETEGKTFPHVTLGDLVTYVGSELSLTVNVHGQTAADAADTTDEFVVYQQGTVNANRKITATQLAAGIARSVVGNAVSSQSALASTDALLFVDENGNFKKVNRDTAGISTGNVTGANSSVDGDIPAWNGTTGKAIKAGFSPTKTTESGGVTTSNISSASTDSQLPTSKAVYRFADEKIAASRLVSGPVVTAGNPVFDKIARFSGDASLKGDLDITTSIAAHSQTSDAKLPTEKAVSTAVKAVADQAIMKAQEEGATVGGSFVTVTSSGTNYVEGGTYAPTTSIRAAASASDTKIPTERAVANTIANIAEIAPIVTTENNIPQWSSGSGKLKNGLLVSTELPSIGGSNSSIPTERAVVTAIGNCLKNTDQTPGWVAKFDSSGEVIAGYDVTSVIVLPTTANSLVTAEAVVSEINSSKTTLYNLPSTAGIDAQSGYPTGTFGYKTSGNVTKLYLNIGTSQSAQWLKFSPDAS